MAKNVREEVIRMAQERMANKEKKAKGITPLQQQVINMANQRQTEKAQPQISNNKT